MPTSPTVTYNSYQKIIETAINQRVVVQPYNWALCPAGHKAIVKGSAYCSGLGASTQSFFQVNGHENIPIRSVIPNGSTNANMYEIAVGVVFPFEVELEAGDILESNQNNGTNAEWNIFGMVRLTPI